MMEPVAAYIVAISAMLFCGVTALTLIYTVKRFDPPDVHSPVEEVPKEVAV